MLTSNRCSSIQPFTANWQSSLFLWNSQAKPKSDTPWFLIIIDQFPWKHHYLFFSSSAVFAWEHNEFSLVNTVPEVSDQSLNSAKDAVRADDRCQMNQQFSNCTDEADWSGNAFCQNSRPKLVNSTHTQPVIY